MRPRDRGEARRLATAVAALCLLFTVPGTPQDVARGSGIDLFEVDLSGPGAADYAADVTVAEGDRLLARELARRAPHLVFCSRLARAAEAYASALPARGGPGPPMAFLQFVVTWAGSADVEVGVTTMQTTEDGVADLWGCLSRRLGQAGAVTHVGIGRARGDGDPYLWRWVVVTARRRAIVASFPRVVEGGLQEALRFRLAGDLDEPEVLVLGGGSGRLSVAPAVADGRGGWTAEILVGEEPGEHWVEIVAHDARGPHVAALFPVYAEVPPPVRWQGVREPDEPWVVTPDDAEQLLYDLLDGERRSRGLPPLTRDPRLADIARRHSDDMLARGYVGHVSPQGKTLSDRLRLAGYVASRSAENVGRNVSLYGAHSSLLRSPGHRAKMLASDMTHVGIGVAVDGLLAGDRIFLVTQEFSFPRRRREPEELRLLVRSRVALARAQASLAELDAEEYLERAADDLAVLVREGRLPDGGLVVAAQSVLAERRVRWTALFVESLELHDTEEVPLPVVAGERRAQRAGVGVATGGDGDWWPVVAVVLLVSP